MWKSSGMAPSPPCSTCTAPSIFAGHPVVVACQPQARCQNGQCAARVPMAREASTSKVTANVSTTRCMHG